MSGDPISQHVTVHIGSHAIAGLSSLVKLEPVSGEEWRLKAHGNTGLLTGKFDFVLTLRMWQ